MAPSYVRQTLREVLWFCSGWTFHYRELSRWKPHRFHIQGRNCSRSLCDSWGSATSRLNWHLFLLGNRGCFAGRLGSARSIPSVYPFGRLCGLAHPSGQLCHAILRCLRRRRRDCSGWTFRSDPLVVHDGTSALGISSRCLRLRSGGRGCVSSLRVSPIRSNLAA